MNAIISCIKYHSARSLEQNEIKNVLIELAGLVGVTSLDVEPDSVIVEYSSMQLSPDIIKDAMLKGGFPFKKDPPKKGFIKKFILDLGQENQKQFGGQTPKCCGNH